MCCTGHKPWGSICVGTQLPGTTRRTQPQEHKYRLDASGISDASRAAHRLAPLQRLRHVCLLGEVPVDVPRSMARLPPLPALEVLQIHRCVRADGGLLAIFQKLPRLAELYLSAVDRGAGRLSMTFPGSGRALPCQHNLRCCS